jgi:rare lipoprotein A
MQFRLVFLILAISGGAAEAAVGEQHVSIEVIGVERPLFSQVGIATYYGGGSVGRETASGERLARHGLTAAHRTLPFGTIIRVTNLQNGRVAMVRINDRGPNVRRKAPRILDVSRDAAAILGITKCGIAKIKIEELASDQPAA